MLKTAPHHNWRAGTGIAAAGSMDGLFSVNAKALNEFTADYAAQHAEEAADKVRLKPSGKRSHD